jgi:hypothetical protein
MRLGGQTASQVGVSPSVGESRPFLWRAKIRLVSMPNATRTAATFEDSGELTEHTLITGFHSMSSKALDVPLRSP